MFASLPRFIAMCSRLFTICVFALCAGNLQAQFTSGVEGDVRDSSGAKVPGAQITVTNQKTAVKGTATTGGEGNFRVMGLPPGTYSVEVTSTGFSSWIQRDMKLEGNQVRTVYPELAVGQQKSIVEVSATGSSVETAKSSVDRTIETKTIEEAPLVGRNIYAGLAALAPGITGSGGSFGGASGSGSQGTNSFGQEPAFQINAGGQRQESNEYQIDGSSVNGNSRDGIVNLTPEPDTVAELKISSNVFSAEKGRESGALIEVYTKPGTNQLHASVSEVHTNNALTSRTVFQDNVPVFRRNEFGGTIGGPIIKDRTFFFGSAYQLLSSQGVTQTLTVETPQFRDYVTQHFPDSLASQFLSRAPAGGNPASGFQSVGQIESSLPSFYPTSNLPSDLLAVGNVSINQSPALNARQWHFRIDHNMNGDKDRLYYSHFRTTSNAEVADPRPSYSYVSPNAGLFEKIDYTHTFSPSLVNDVSATYVRASGNNPGAPKNLDLPNVNITGVGDGFNQWGPNGWVHNNYSWHDALSYVRGKHNLRVGIDIDRQQDLDNFTNAYTRPSFSFANILDFAVDRPLTQGGVALDTGTGQIATSVYQHIEMLYIAPYVQDDWKINSRLTVNFGLRLDYFGHFASAKNGNVPFSLFTAGSGSTFEEQIANGYSRNRGKDGFITTDPVYRFAPRIGFGWDVFGNGSTAVRGGWGIYNNRIGNLSYAAPSRANAPDFAIANINVRDPGVSPNDFTYVRGNADGSGFQLPRGVSAQINDRGGLVGNRVSIAGADPNLTIPLVQNWALSVQQRLSNSIVVEADYVGTHSENLYVQTDVNRFAGDLITNNGILERLNPYFGSAVYGRSIGIGNGQLGSFVFSKRFSERYSAHAIYTVGKALDYTSSNDNGVGGAESVINAQDPARQYGRSDYDVRKRFTLDSVLDIPSPLRSGIGHAILSGWTTSAIVTLQSGQPFTVYTSAPFPAGDYNADGYGFDLPNTPFFGNYVSTSRSDYIKGLFAPGIFPTPPIGQEGNLGRNTFDGPGLANVNISFQRSFSIPLWREKGALQFRAEIFNLFNRVNLTQPDGDLSSGTFGRSTDQNLPRAAQFTAKFQF